MQQKLWILTNYKHSLAFYLIPVLILILFFVFIIQTFCCFCIVCVAAISMSSFVLLCFYCAYGFAFNFSCCLAAETSSGGAIKIWSDLKQRFPPHPHYILSLQVLSHATGWELTWGNSEQQSGPTRCWSGSLHRNGCHSCADWPAMARLLQGRPHLLRSCCWAVRCHKLKGKQSEFKPLPIGAVSAAVLCLFPCDIICVGACHVSTVFLISFNSF